MINPVYCQFNIMLRVIVSAYVLSHGAFWDMEQVHSGICELGQLLPMS